MKATTKQSTNRLLTGVALAALITGTLAGGYALAAETGRTGGGYGFGMMHAGNGDGYGMMHAGNGDGKARHQERLDRLDLNEEQQALWETFREEMHPAGDRGTRHQQMRAIQEAGFLGRLAGMERMMEERAENMAGAREAAERFYRSLNADQRSLMDEARHGGMRNGAGTHGMNNHGGNGSHRNGHGPRHHG